MLRWLVVKFLIHYVIWFFISVAEVSGNNNVSLSNIEDEIDMSLASQGITTNLEVASNPKMRMCGKHWFPNFSGI
jgi:hypothetical protein